MRPLTQRILMWSDCFSQLLSEAVLKPVLKLASSKPSVFIFMLWLSLPYMISYHPESADTVREVRETCEIHAYSLLYPQSTGVVSSRGFSLACLWTNAFAPFIMISSLCGTFTTPERYEPAIMMIDTLTEVIGCSI